MAGFDILTNISSLQAQNYLNQNLQFQSQTINEVTSGQAIINAGDNAAGLAVANTYRSDEAVLTQGIANANDGLATLQTIDGGMSDISQLLDSASTLASQSASQTFQGNRTVLNDQFQSVLAEINREAQAIGMGQGGQFNANMSVFIGGGANDTANPTAADAITNGSIQINLANSALDTNALGLSSNGVAGANVLAGSNTISTALTQSAPVLTFTGSGYTVNVSVPSADWTADTITDQNALVTQLNDAIATAGAGNAAFAAAGIQASVNATTGDLTFSSNQAFAVQEASTGAQTLLGTGNVLFSAASSIPSVAWTDLTAGDALTFSYRDSTGAMQQQTVNLVNTETLASAVAQINGTSGMGGIFAVAGGAAGTANAITFMNQNGGAFELTSVQAGGTGITTGVYGSGTTLQSSNNLDILTSSDATAAVTALANAVQSLGTIQGTVGEGENALGYAINLAQSQNTNLAASEAQIRDANMATEAANLTKAQILVQAGVAALAQANSAPQQVLTLLKS